MDGGATGGYWLTGNCVTATAEHGDEERDHQAKTGGG